MATKIHKSGAASQGGPIMFAPGAKADVFNTLQTGEHRVIRSDYAYGQLGRGHK